MKDEIKKIKQAIKHCQEVQKDSCIENGCKVDHKNLETWLTELLFVKESLKLFCKKKNC